MKSTCLGKSGQTTRSTAESRPLPRAEERARPCCLLCLRPRKPERQLWLREALEHVAGLGSHSAAAVIFSKSSIDLMVAAWPLSSPPKHCSLLPFPSFPSGRSSLCCPSLAALFGYAESRLGGFQDFTPQHRAPKPLPWIRHEALKHPYSSCSWVRKKCCWVKKKYRSKTCSVTPLLHAAADCMVPRAVMSEGWCRSPSSYWREHWTSSIHSRTRSGRVRASVDTSAHITSASRGQLWASHVLHKHSTGSASKTTAQCVCGHRKEALQKNGSWWGQRGLPVVWRLVGPNAGCLARAGNPVRVPEEDYNMNEFH